ncbi:hypothetical protein B7939_01145 [Eggerthia catenaformis]|nr:hypothetical protein B7939_01145 [Eggerthia catenaformis]
MKNTMLDLNNHLFEQLERLNDEDLSPEQLKTEIARAKAMASIAGNIIANSSNALDAIKLKTEYSRVELPEFLIGVKKRGTSY